MHGGVTAGAPTAAELEFVRVIFAPDEDLSRTDERALRLRVALEAKIVVALDDELGVDRAVRVVADGAAFAQRFVLEDEGFGLVAMALRAGLVEAGHGETGGGFQHVGPVRVVALDAIHSAFDDLMMLRQIEFGVGFQMTIETSGRVFAGIENKFAATTADLDVLAARAVTGFATARTNLRIRGKVHAGMCTGGKGLNVTDVTGEAGLIAGEMSAGNFRREDNLTRGGGAGVQQHEQTTDEADGQQRCAAADQSPALGG